MGAAPRTTPTPAQVAHSFVSVYYRVAAKLPYRLGEFYGASSELDHGDGLCARGPAIAQVAERLPIAGGAASVGSLSVQQTGSGAYVVVVVGTFSKAAETVPFTQTFVLEKQVDSHDEHFFCRNDIFTPFSAAEGDIPLGNPESVKADANTASVSSDAPQIPPEDVESAKQPAASPVTPTKQMPPAESIPTEVLEPSSDVTESRSVPEITSVPLPDAAVNGSSEFEVAEPEPDTATETTNKSVETPAPAEPLPEATAKQPDEPALAPAPLPNGDAEENQPVRAAPVAPVQKTWASIVSSKDDATNGPATPAPVADDAPPQPLAKEQVENIPPTTETETKTNQNGNNRPAGMQNGHRPTHHVNRGNHPRTFGPSAVVQLATLNPTQLQDPRGLSNSLRDEFGNYGYKLRNVDVKAQKGIAFVEYETLEGVKAAVAKWANGPRTEGAFAGIALQVSEKRPSHGGRRPGSVRGGRGGARGARRSRPNSTPLS